MMRCLHRGRRRAAPIPLAGVLVLALALAIPARSQDLTLTPPQMREVAARALAGGAPQIALRFSDALLGRDPGDVQALVLRTRAARALGRFPEAVETGQRAWSSAEAPAERYAAALVTAQALASDGHHTRAQWWLRRAIQHAPSDRLRQIAVRDFRHVRARNPWAAELRFNIAPTSNVNGGSANTTTKLYDLPFDFALTGPARALSGTEISAGLTARYRLSESAEHRNDLLLRLDHRTYVLSDEAKAQAPGVKGGDFAFTAAAASFAHGGRAGIGGGPYQLTATLGHARYGGDPYMNFLQLGAMQHFVLSSRSAARLSVMREVQQGLDRRRDSDSWTIGTGLSHVLDGGARIDLTARAAHSESRDANLDYDRVSVDLRYAPGHAVLGTSLEFGVAASYKTHDRSAFSADGRQEREISAEVTAVFDRIDYYGFVPSLTLRAARTHSNIGLYDTEELGVHLGIRSAF